ncbi:DUF1015 domain-containing protein [Chloroflexota bacterium]
MGRKIKLTEGCVPPLAWVKLVGMADIRPFRGVHYNQSLVNDLASVICPPYDVINAEQRQEFYRRSEYNFVRLEFAQELPGDTSSDNKYNRAAATLEEWLKQGILEVDEDRAIYLHDHYFIHRGSQYKRRGIIARVRLEEWDKMVVRPHEGTMAEPKGDRLKLLWALQANISPILVLYEDRAQQISTLLAIEERGKPMINVEGANGEVHRVWAITESEVIAKISNSLSGEPLYIADGHHRYESALAYQCERRACLSSVSEDEDFDFVMVNLLEFSDPGLIILPPHRLVRGLSKLTLDNLLSRLELLFEMQELPLSMPSIWNRVDDLIARANETRLILFGLGVERLLVLKVRDLAALSQMMPDFHSELYKRLEVSIIDHVILEKLLATDGQKVTLGYSYDRLEAVNKVLNAEYQLAFLIRSVKGEAIKAIADVGDRMPRKSTYFYPKAPAGVIFSLLTCP